jgi:transcriptional regulator of acetoin/glycerol metabolism
VKRALRDKNGRLTEAAKALGIGRTTLYRKLEKYGLR